MRFRTGIFTAYTSRNPSNPRLASSSKDGTVRIWSLQTRRMECTLGGHTASVNVVKWGGVRDGVLYTASSDRTVKVWDAKNVSLVSLIYAGRMIDGRAGQADVHT
jgi:WD40 repeat protein